MKAQRLVTVTKALLENIDISALDFIYIIYEHTN